MYAYCLNSPVNGCDPSGMRFQDPNCRSCGGRNEYTDAGTGTPYFYNQKDKNVKDKSVGLSTVGHSGCGPVAIYNAEVSLGHNPNFDDILDYFDTSNTLFFGFAGVLPNDVISNFKDRAYTVVTTTDINKFSVVSDAADTCIMWYLYTTMDFPWIGGHYVQYDRTELGYFARNVFSDRNYKTFTCPENLATCGSHFCALYIGIYAPRP